MYNLSKEIFSRYCKKVKNVFLELFIWIVGLISLAKDSLDNIWLFLINSPTFVLLVQSWELLYCGYRDQCFIVFLPSKSILLFHLYYHFPSIFSIYILCLSVCPCVSNQRRKRLNRSGRNFLVGPHMTPKLFWFL